jgi:hypothetical protein
MSKAIKKQENSVVINDDLGLDAWGASPVSAQDIVIPKILCMQGLSELVTEDQAKMGDFVDSLTKQVIGSASKPIEFIPFHLEKIWIISEKKAGESDFSFKEIVPVTPANEGMRYQEVVDGVELKREYTRNFYVLRPDDMGLPYIISFKGMSAKAGKQLATQMYVKNAAEGKNPAAKVMKLGGFKEKNAKGTYYVLSTTEARDSEISEQKQALQWYKTVNAGQTQAHEEHPVQKAEGFEETRF